MPINDSVIQSQEPGADFTIDQVWTAYPDDEHDIWNTLYRRQIEVLEHRAVPQFYLGLDALDLNRGGIPDVAKINKAMMKLTGWQVVSVPHLVPDDVFFEHLANRRFPAGRFIRARDQLEYIQEPDVFHDVFGHVPMLTSPVFADYMQAYGQGGLRALGHDRLPNLSRLYWYTVEFGLMRAGDEFKIYGAGLTSSYTESGFCTDSDSPNRIHFDLERIMLTDYRIDDFQQVYFVIDSFDELIDTTLQDFGPLYDQLKKIDRMYGVTDIRPTDKVYTQGTQAYVAKH